MLFWIFFSQNYTSSLQRQVEIVEAHAYFQNVHQAPTTLLNPGSVIYIPYNWYQILKSPKAESYDRDKSHTQFLIFSSDNIFCILFFFSTFSQGIKLFLIVAAVQNLPETYKTLCYLPKIFINQNEVHYLQSGVMNQENGSLAQVLADLLSWHMIPRKLFDLLCFHSSSYKFG